MSSKKRVSRTRSGKRINMKLVRESALVRAKVFEAIGHFIFQFSQLEFTIRFALAAYLKLPDEYFDAITGPYDFRMLVAVASKIGQLRHPERKDQIKKTYDDCFTLMEVRNHVAHGMWQDGITEWSVRHWNRNKLEATQIPYTSDELNTHAARAQRLLKQVMGFKPYRATRVR
jgi:hypothetical protein